MAENVPVLRSVLGPARCAELQRLDEAWADSPGKTIFDWSRLATFKARNWVGVVEAPGVIVEILPKIEGLEGVAARRNLLYMLAVAGDLPIRERDLASLSVEKSTLLDALILIFSERLLSELCLGHDHAYVLREENIGYVKGKIVQGEHLRRNVAQQHRMYCSFDEFSVDTPLNQILKRTCKVLLSKVRSLVAEHNLRSAMHAFDAVQDVPVQLHHFERVHLTRTSNRFATLLEFCRIVLLDGSPSLRAGDRKSFTLLFPMEKVFERFIARAIVRDASALALDNSTVSIQARGAHQWLVFEPGGKLRFRLDPDVLIRESGLPRLIVDTKWKRLLSSDEDPKNGISRDDMYQMAAYATRYECDDNVLVFPRVPGVEPRQYTLPVSPKPRTIRVEFVDLSRDLLTNRQALIADLRQVISSAS